MKTNLDLILERLNVMSNEDVYESMKSFFSKDDLEKSNNVFPFDEYRLIDPAKKGTDWNLIFKGVHYSIPKKDRIFDAVTVVTTNCKDNNVFYSYNTDDNAYIETLQSNYLKVKESLKIDIDDEIEYAICA